MYIYTCAHIYIHTYIDIYTHIYIQYHGVFILSKSIMLTWLKKYHHAVLLIQLRQKEGETSVGEQSITVTLLSPSNIITNTLQRRPASFPEATRIHKYIHILKCSFLSEHFYCVILVYLKPLCFCWLFFTCHHDSVYQVLLPALPITAWPAQGHCNDSIPSFSSLFDFSVTVIQPLSPPPSFLKKGLLNHIQCNAKPQFLFPHNNTSQESLH